MRSENLVSSQFSFKFSLFHVKLDLIVFASPKTPFENKSASIGLRRKKPSEIVFRLQNRIKKVLHTWNSTNNKWTKFGDLKNIFENNWTFVEQFRKRKYILKRLFNLWQCHFSAKAHRTRYVIFAEFNLLFDCKYVWARLPNLKTSKRSINAENGIAFRKNSSSCKITSKKIALFFHLRLDICRKSPKPHSKPSQRYLQTALNEKNLQQLSFVRKFKVKVGSAPRTQLTIIKQLKGDLKVLFANSLKYVGQSREQKYSVWNILFWQISIERYFYSSELD